MEQWLGDQNARQSEDDGRNLAQHLSHEASSVSGALQALFRLE